MLVQGHQAWPGNAQMIQKNPGVAGILSCNHAGLCEGLGLPNGYVLKVADRGRNYVQRAPLRRARFTCGHFVCLAGKLSAACRSCKEFKCIRYTEVMPLPPAVGSVLALISALAVTLTTGCASPGALTRTDSQTNPNTASSGTASQNLPAAIPAPSGHDLAELEPGTSAWDFLQRALVSTQLEADTLFLAAAKKFLESGFSAPARIVLNRVSDSTPETWTSRQYQLLRSALALAEQRPKRSWQLLVDLDHKALDPLQQALMWELQLRALFAANEIPQALAFLRAPSSEGTPAGQTQSFYHLAFSQLTRLHRDTLEELGADATLTPQDQAWVSLAVLHARQGWNDYQLREALTGWTLQHPGHPATSIAIELRPQHCPIDQVALLLPLSSSYREAALAFHDGFMSLHQIDSDPAKPIVRVYDFGEQIALVPTYYDQALKEGAQKVVGPLGRKAVAALANHQRFPVPTLLLGSGEFEARPGAFILDLSRQREARTLAVHARRRGLRRALILHSADGRSERAARSGATAWAQHGGIILDTTVIPTGINDYSGVLGNLLGLDESAQRAQRLQGLLGGSTQLHSVPRRRQDFDVILLFTDQSTARLLKPQIDFHRAGSIPIYSLNTIYNGKPDPAVDLDLEGIVFSDMPWLVRSGGRFDRTGGDFPLNAPYRHLATDRLFALGMDAYRLSCLSSQGQLPARQTWAGASGLLTLQPDGQIHRLADWVHFRDGTPRALESPLSPMQH